MYEDYQGSTDEELIDRLRQGEKQITDYIMDKYKNLVRRKAKSMYILGADSDEEMQASIPLLICVYPDRCILRCRLPEERSMPH